MTARWLMTGSAAVFGALGVAASFLPQELLETLRDPPSTASVLAIQLLGAAWLALATMNWMSRGMTIGGIYGRPLTVTNLTCVTISAIVLGKLLLRAPQAPIALLLIAFALLAAGFGWLLFHGPNNER